MTTYTSSLRLWKGTPGDPAIATAWGTPLNTNDDLAEAAITLPTTVNIAGLTTYSLTVNNGATDQARNLVQQYTGALTANCTVTLPNVPKYGWAQNNTTGGFSVILTAGAGTTATVLPDGLLHYYYADGSTNVSLPTIATSPSGNLTVTSVTASGTISAAQYNALNASSVSTPILAIDGSNNTNVTIGGPAGSFQVKNAAGSSVLFGVQSSNGLVTIGNSVNIGGTAAITSTATILDNVFLGTASIDPVGTGTPGWRVIGSSGAGFRGEAQGYCASNAPLVLSTSSTAELFFYYYPAGGPLRGVGTISTTGTSVAYNTTSDARLKMGYGLIIGEQSGPIIDNLLPRWFRWTSDMTARPQPGFFAQEVNEVYPWAVVQGKGRTDDADFVPWQMDQAKLIPVLVAELQALRMRVADLEGKVCPSGH